MDELRRRIDSVAADLCRLQEEVVRATAEDNERPNLAERCRGLCSRLQEYLLLNEHLLLRHVPIAVPGRAPGRYRPRHAPRPD